MSTKNDWKVTEHEIPDVSVNVELREFTESDLKWIKRFERVMKDAPSHLFMFVGAGAVTMFPERVMKSAHDGSGDVVDQTKGIDIFTLMECDGGDY